MGSSSATRNRSTTGGMVSFATALNDHPAINTSSQMNERTPRFGSCEARRYSTSPVRASPEAEKNTTSTASTGVTGSMHAVQ